MYFKLPELGEGVHEGELVVWKTKAGDTVKHDQILFEIMTDKATVEFPSPFDGKIIELLAKEGQIIKVGQEIINYDLFGAKAQSEQKHAVKIQEINTIQSAAVLPVSSPGSSGLSTGSARVLASPATRRLARESGVDLAKISGSGPHGRVLQEDIKKTLTPNVVGKEERVPWRGLRKKIAEKMRLSKDKAAHFTYVEEADVSELVKLRDQAKIVGKEKGIKVTYLPFIMKFMVDALKKFPILNSTLDEEKGELVYKHYYNIGLSIQTDEGLMAPVIKGVEHLGIFQLAKALEDLVERARKKQLKLEDFQGGTVTITNAGSIGGLFATPIINYPEVAILGFNKISKKPVVKNIHGHHGIVICDWTYFSISLDHRIVDGAVGAEFMKEFIHSVENPSVLLLE
ncbi:MAG: 2-oxo acid dehydrogenase subunit E2 [Deltaproteobacteria bacterium]|nr:2-oxo acid dehydrogenase subunit E2 [Deltaproteobacteria bacterium]